MRKQNFTYSGELVKTRFKRIDCDIPARFKAGRENTADSRLKFSIRLMVSITH